MSHPLTLLYISFNLRPPSFAFGPDYETNPGKPLKLTAIPDNDDSGEKFTCFWEILDYSTT